MTRRVSIAEALAILNKQASKNTNNNNKSIIDKYYQLKDEGQDFLAAKFLVDSASLLVNKKAA